MPRKVTPLTATQINHAKPKEKEYNLSDGDGLMLRVRPSGTKLWLFNYHHPITKKRTNLAIGNYPAVSLADARKRRSESQELLAKGICPKQHRDQCDIAKRKAATNTLETIAGQWLEVKRTKVSEDHANDIWRSLEKHIFPDLGHVPISDITAPGTIDIIQSIAAKGNLETVKRLCQRLNEIMVYATNTGVIHHNPLAGINDAFQTPIKHNLPSLRPEELPELMHALGRASIRRTTRCLIEWQLHTMVRPSEAAGARWDEIDFESELWRIPAERMKRNRPHTVPLTPQMLAVLKEMLTISGKREHIFPGERNPRQHINPSTANMVLKRMGYGGRMVAHGFRSLASTILNEEGFDPDVIESALAHAIGNNVRATYNRAEYLERRRTMMLWWSTHIEQQASTTPTASMMDVITSPT